MFCCTLFYAHSNFAIILMGKGESWFFAVLVFLVSRDGCVALPRSVTGLSAVCGCGISDNTHLLSLTLLLEKVKHYKLSDKTINWFSSYLLDKKQKAVINNIESKPEIVVCGVLKGSILGTLLFLIFYK